MGGARKWCWPMLLLLAAGCGTGTGEVELVPVYGKVTFRGRPLAGGTIVFVPDPERGAHGPLALAVLDAQGRFTLHSDGRPGVVPGWHRITVAAAQSVEDEPALPSRYADPERSGLAREVQAGKASVFDLVLE